MLVLWLEQIERYDENTECQFPTPHPMIQRQKAQFSLEAYPIFSIEAPLSVEVQVHTSTTDINLHTDQDPLSLASLNSCSETEEPAGTWPGCPETLLSQVIHKK